MDADEIMRASVGARTALQNTPGGIITLEPIITPGPESLFEWLKAVAPYIKMLGGHPDDAFDSHTLKMLEYAKLTSRGTQAVNVETRKYRQKNWPLLWEGLKKHLVANALGLFHVQCFLLQEARDEHDRVVLEQTLCSMKLVTNAGADAMVDAFTNTFELETYNFHGVGTGTNAENVSNTALQTELTTALSPDNTRATGTQSQPASTIYQSLGTTTYDSSQAITEHGLFTQAATGGGGLWDRSVFSVINAASIQHTHQTTITSGG